MRVYCSPTTTYSYATKRPPSSSLTSSTNHASNQRITTSPWLLNPKEKSGLPDSPESRSFGVLNSRSCAETEKKRSRESRQIGSAIQGRLMGPGIFFLCSRQQHTNIFSFSFYSIEHIVIRTSPQENDRRSTSSPHWFLAGRHRI